MKNIVVFATALRKSGGITIYNQFIKHLQEHIGDNRYLIFKNEITPVVQMDGVKYVIVDTSSLKSRLFFDFYKSKKILIQYDFTPDVVLSLQNFGVFSLRDVKQYVYYHNPMALFPQKWNFFKKSERGLFIHKYINPLLFKISVTSSTKYFVQTDFVKKEFVRKFKLSSSKVRVAFPDVELIDVDKVDIIEHALNEVHLIYPATPLPYKNHITIVNALKVIKDLHPDIINSIRIHFTLRKGMMPHLEQLITLYGLENNFNFHGVISHENLLRLYKSSDGLLFPSVIETLGLPLLEAASFGIPIVVSNLAYSRAVIGNYAGALFVEANNKNQWVEKILYIIKYKPHYDMLKQRTGSSWDNVFFDNLG